MNTPAGLIYVPDYISEEHHQRLIHTIDAQNWSDALKRRTQHYGWIYDYRSRSVRADQRLGDLPGWLASIGNDLVHQSGSNHRDHLPFESPHPPLVACGRRVGGKGHLSRYFRAAVLATAGYFATAPDQCIINDYQPGQGIAQHIDCPPCFGDIVGTLSLSSGIQFDMDKPGPSQHYHVWLPPRSLLIMTGESRKIWRHGIAARMSDLVEDRAVPRGRRVSLTFRNVIIETEIPSATNNSVSISSRERL